MWFAAIPSWWKSSQYRQLRRSGEDGLRCDVEDRKALTDVQDQVLNIGIEHARRRQLWPVCLIWLNLALFSISSTLFVLSLVPPRPLYVDRTPERPRNHELRHFAMPSSAPPLDELDLRIAPKRMDGTLLNTKPPVMYRREPSHDVDAAWAALYDTRPIQLTREQVLAIGKDPEQAVRIPESWGRGNDSYFRRLDVFHQLHCLDALRREARFDHYYASRYPGGFNTTTRLHQLHLTHCAWMLAQNIMCAATTDVYTHMWTDAVGHAFPDFQIEHKCKNYESVLEWQRRNALDEEAFVGLRRPDGYPYRVTTHEFKEIHGWFSTHEDDGDYETGEII